MSLRVSTTGSDVSLDDLGIKLTHPTTNLDLTEQFTAIDLRNSADLTAAIEAGDLDVDDGTHFIHKDDYDPDGFLIQELGYNKDVLYISHDELASINNILINKTGFFPLALNSTAASTRNVYQPAGRFITWQLAPGDIVVISGSSGADGTYTVESVTDQQNFIVVESIADSTGGTTNIYHPGGAKLVGVDPAQFTWTAGTNLQQALDDLSAAIQQIKIQDEGTDLANTPHTTLNFTGAGVTAVDIDGDIANVVIPGAAGGSRVLDFSYSTGNTPYIGFNATDWVVASSFIWRGSGVLGIPSSIKAVASISSGTTQGEIRVVNSSNGDVLAYTTFTNTEPEIIDLGTISNVPSGEVILEVQVLATGGNPQVRVYALSVYF